MNGPLVVSARADFETARPALKRQLTSDYASFKDKI